MIALLRIRSITSPIVQTTTLTWHSATKWLYQALYRRMTIVESKSSFTSTWTSKARPRPSSMKQEAVLNSIGSLQPVVLTEILATAYISLYSWVMNHRPSNYLTSSHKPLNITMVLMSPSMTSRWNSASHSQIHGMVTTRASLSSIHMSLVFLNLSMTPLMHAVQPISLHSKDLTSMLLLLVER
jgi:hypothetical protein